MRRQPLVLRPGRVFPSFNSPCFMRGGLLIVVPSGLQACLAAGQAALQSRRCAVGREYMGLSWRRAEWRSMTLAEIVEISARVGLTAGRLAKIDTLAGCLRAAQADEVGIAVRYLPARCGSSGSG